MGGPPPVDGWTAGPAGAVGLTEPGDDLGAAGPPHGNRPGHRVERALREADAGRPPRAWTPARPVQFPGGLARRSLRLLPSLVQLGLEHVHALLAPRLDHAGHDQR